MSRKNSVGVEFAKKWTTTILASSDRDKMVDRIVKEEGYRRKATITRVANVHSAFKKGELTKDGIWLV